MVRSSKVEMVRFTRLADDLLEVRLLPGARIDPALISSVIEERMRLSEGKDMCLLTVVPADAELDISVMNHDHYRLEGSTEGVHALAIVAGSLLLETMTRLYAAYFPPSFDLAVFQGEGEARIWLEEELAVMRKAREGS